MKILILTFILVALVGIVFLSIPMKRPLSLESITKSELRKPGFVFIEFQTRKLDQYIYFFNKVANFKLIRREPKFALMESDSSQLLLMNPDDLPNNHPFYGKLLGKEQGLGVEVGIVVNNLKQVFNMVLEVTMREDKEWKISSDIIHRPWGVNDFRVLSPDGYYLRFTEPPHQ